MVKIATLLHSVDAKLFGKLSYKSVTLAYLPIFLYLMVVAMGLEWFAAKQSLVVAITMTFFIFTLMPFSIASKMTNPKVLEKLNKGAFSRRRLIEFDEEGMLIRWETGSYSMTKWEDIHKAEDCKGGIRIWPSQAMGHLVPDSAWPSAKERGQILALLREKNLLK